ncbi:AAEL000637-PA [Aedes aegypti]|uniref:AAEL000637-PA n=1 Tax=Aedes aegypti TaxID=7159 RepID=Q17NJ7_AEDAE|nr:AAEL000637-PA [Aedes aegypti]
MENENLKENFKFFYRIAKVLILELNDEDRVLAAQWLRKLAACQSPEDSERRNHYMTLLLITLQQKRIVGPFKKTPPDGNKLEPFQKEIQASDIQKLLDEELAQRPPPPLAQFGLTGGKMSTEFAVTQEIPKFGVHFYYVYTLEPIYDFQRANQSRIPPPMRGPSQSTMRDLNAGIEHLLRSEKKKLKVTVDQLGRKQIQIRDEHFAEFSGPSRPRRVPKRLQKRLGFKAPEPEPEQETPLTSFVQESTPPRRTPQPSTSSTTVEEAVAAAVGAAVAAAASSPRGSGAVPRPTGAIPKRPRTIPRPSGAVPRHTGAIPKASRAAQAPPQPSSPHVPVIEVQPPSPVRAPSVPIRRSPIRFTPHPFAPETPPLFSAGTPSKRGERVQVLDIIKQYPIPEQTLHVTPDERMRIRTPEIEHEVAETMRRSNLMFQTDDTRTREIMRKYYASKPVLPKALEFAPEEETTTQQPFLLDTSPVAEKHPVQIHTPPSLPRILTPRTPLSPSSRPPTPRGATTPRGVQPARSPRQLTDWFVEDEGLLDDEDIQLRDELIYIPSPVRASAPRAPTPSPRQWQEEGLLEDEDIQFVDDQPSPPQWKTPVMPLVRTRPPVSTPRYSPEVSPGGTTARLIDAGDDIPEFTPRSPRSVASMMDDIMLTTPERMEQLANIMSQIGQQVEAHRELIQNIEEIPRTPSIENLRIECARGAETLTTLHSRLRSLRQSAQTKTPINVDAAPPEMAPEEPVPFSPIRLSLQFQDLSDVINATVEGAQIIQQVAESVPEPVVQEAADRSIDSVGALQEISDRVHDVAKVWEKRIVDLDTSSFGLIDDEELDESLFASPARQTANRMVEALDQSVKEVIAEGGDPRSPAARNLQSSLRDFREALHNLSMESPSFLDESFPADALLDATLDELENSIQSGAAATSAVSKTPDNAAILDKAEAIVEAMNDVLDDVQSIVAPDGVLEDEVDEDEQFVEEFFAESRPQQELPPPPEAMQEEMLNLLEKTRLQQQALLESSLEIEENAVDAAAVAASQQATQMIQQAQQVVTDMITSVAGSPFLEDDKDFAWLGPMALEPETRSTTAGRRQMRPPARSATRQAAARVPTARPTAPRPAAPRPAAPRPAAARPAAARPSAARPTSARTPARPQAIRRPARGASPEPFALPAGVQAPRPRAGSATPIPVRRPPRPIPLPGSTSATQIPAQPSSSGIRTMLPRPGSTTADR